MLAARQILILVGAIVCVSATAAADPIDDYVRSQLGRVTFPASRSRSSRTAASSNPRATASRAWS